MDEAKVQEQCDEPLLSAVMEIALDFPPFDIARVDDACSRGSDLGQLGEVFGRQPLALESQLERNHEVIDFL